MPKTLFIDSTPEIDVLWQKVAAAGAPPIAVNTQPITSVDVPRLLEGFDTCVLDATYLGKSTLRACKSLRHIVFLGTGAASCVDLEAAEALGIKVSTIRGYGDTTVAEHAMGLVFAAARRIGTMHHIMRSGGWNILSGMQLKGKTIGIVGLGGIGREMYRLSKGIGSLPVAWNRSPISEAGYEMVGLDDLIAKSDIISLHLGLNPQTRGFVNADLLSRTKPGVIIVNSSRAAIVDEAAMLKALASGHVGHYATDVFEPEPLPADSAWRQLDNVTLTCHAGYNTPEAASTMYRRAMDIVAAS